MEVGREMSEKLPSETQLCAAVVERGFDAASFGSSSRAGGSGR
jgi:hypothetical protein